MPEPLAKIKTNTQQTWQTHSSNSSASSTSSRYHLNEADNSPILVYKWGGDVSTSSQEELCKELDEGMSKSQTPATRHTNSVHAVHNRGKSRVTKVPIPRFTSTLEVKRHNLYTLDEQQAYKDLPNYNTSLAAIRIPSNVFWGRMLRGTYSELFIVSPETSPEGSIASFGSRKPSPSSTWSNDAETGADHE